MNAPHWRDNPKARGRPFLFSGFRLRPGEDEKMNSQPL